MNFVNLGSSGLKISRIALGMMTFGTPEWRPWILDEEAARPIVRRAIELGVNMFDTADMYSAGVSEEITGKLLREYALRDEIVIATKVRFPVELAFKGMNAPGPKPAPRPNASGLSRKHIFAAVDASLRRLGVECIDLYQIHRFDLATPVEETMEALHDVVKAGKARYIGASSMWAWQFARMQHVAETHGWTRFVSMQNHYNLLYREEEREMVPLCRDQRVGLIPWSPLARGYLARAPEAMGTKRSETDRFGKTLYSSMAEADQRVLAGVDKLAEMRNLPHAQIALAWLLQNDAVTAPIVGATKMEHLETAVAALGVQLSKEEVTALEAPYVAHPIAGFS
jgi:aryl-alcohol dehydrogenase-like predicted oxidoreductase